ncbi:DEAD/DEAH box helicase [Paenibacillus tarimensis]
MNWWSRLSRKNKRTEFGPIRIIFSKLPAGLGISLFQEGLKQRISLPLTLTVTELRNQPDIERLELLETLWFEELLEQHQDGYLLPYDKIQGAPDEVKSALEIPSTIPLELFLNHEGAVGTNHFKFVVEMGSGKWKHIERTAVFVGPWINLPDQSWQLIPQDQYRFINLVALNPDPRDSERIFPYIAQVRSEARRIGIPMDPYLEKQEYKFVDGIEIDLDFDGESIQLKPIYSTSTQDIPEQLLRQLGEGGYSYASNPQHGKIFVQPAAAQKAKVIKDIPSITGQDIPRFAENPEAFIPEIEGLNVESFGERVKSLGIRVYRAQPFVHANEKGRGWFALETGISLVNQEGDTQQDFSTDEFGRLFNGVAESGNEYFQWNGDWIKLPSSTDSFTSAVERIKDAFGESKLIDVTKLPYVLEIFENIGQLEYNQPILEVQKEMLDIGILQPTPPSVFTATLKPFQIDGFVWMKSLHYRKLGGLLADDMGLGKTIQVVSLLSYLFDRGHLSPTLIVVPKTLIENWGDEIRKFAKPLATELYIHQGALRIRDPKAIGMSGITITTYQTLVRDQLAFGQVEWQAVICDEAQAIKNPTTAASKVLKAMNAKFRLALTGTPVENGLSELWSIMDYVQPGLLGSLSEFKREFIDKLENEEHDPGVEKKLLGRISMVYKRRTKSEELAGQLPSKEAVEITIPLGSVQKQLYSEIIGQVRSKKLQALQAIQMLRSVCSHPGLWDPRFKDLPEKDIPKLSRTIALIRDVQRLGEKVLIFTHLREMQEILRKTIRNEFNINPYIINGMTERRQSVVNEFNERSGFDVMILSPHAAGTGLTITSANHVIHYTRWWNPAVENQATDRVYRIGQEKPVKVYYPIVTDNEGVLNSGTVEEIIHRIIGDKQQLASSIVVSSVQWDVQNEVMASVFG